MIPSNDSVRLLSQFVERMNLSDLYKTYSKVKENQASPRKLLKIILYGYMNKLYSSRDIEKACYRDINFIYLLEGSKVPDHSTLIPFLKSMEENLNFKYLKIVADSGYESEENYSFIESNNQISFIKPSNYEISKTRKYQNDISRMKT